MLQNNFSPLPALQKNTVISPNFLAQKLCGNCAFPQNFHTRKLGEITIFLVVLQQKLHKLEAAVCRCSSKQMYLEIRQNLKESFPDIRPTTLFKKRLWHRCFPVIFCKILKKTFFYRTRPVPASCKQIKLREWSTNFLKE